MVSKDDDKVDAMGLPLKSAYEGVRPTLIYPIFTTAMLAFGLAVFYAIYTFGPTSKYDAKIRFLAEYDLGWLYLTVVLVIRLSLVQAIVLAEARKAARAHAPDQHVYKVHGTAASGLKLGYVLMEAEGDVGRFNRAQRALAHYSENTPNFLPVMLLSGFVFSFPAFILSLIYAGGRAVSSVGYANSADGRGPGNMVAFLANFTLEASVWLVAVKALSVS